MEIRNIAIIAHVDHGKTTLVDTLLKQSETLRVHQEINERAMDSNAIERERGITILAKNTAINYHGVRINILDTPGHADFGGEVERIMNMVDAVLLVVDAFEGTMPQTRFVLKKALEAKVKPMVVINKVDRFAARPIEVVDEVLELFIELGADDDQLDFPVVFASGINGQSSLVPELKPTDTMIPLLDKILEFVPTPSVDIEGPLQFQPSLLDYNDYVGRMGIGRIQSGKLKVNEIVSCIRLDGTIKEFRIQKLYGFLGLDKIEIEEAFAGDIVAISGLPDIYVGETICYPDNLLPMPLIHIGEPTVQMTFGTNTSPFSGQEGKFVTSSKIDERLFRETQRDLALKVERSGQGEQWIVSGRGELHLGILIENMRREGFEFQVSQAKVIMREYDGVLCEPFESVQVDCPLESVGAAMELIGSRHGIIESMHNHENQSRLNYVMPSRGLIGFMTEFLTATKGYGIINHTYLEYRPVENMEVGRRKIGVLVAVEAGVATAYSLGAMEDRGIMFIEPRTKVYEGMVIGECNRENDLAVNVVREKQQTNTRSSVKDSTVVLKRPRKMSLEMCLDYINDDELVEVTPKSIRIRKQILDTDQRKKFDSRRLRNNES
ncbi:MAG: translational GTPase TypA [Tenericutes bacterium HGW-Tenericutes-1]|jgi:GTP-binding protein|nr:MAG: translational GTPase TypA [Tenericutes bacterium HGW-Tenericutes-1]